VGLTEPKGLALGAATGTPAVAMSARAMACPGTRTPTVGRPAVTRSGSSGRFGSTRVRGPGQKRPARTAKRGSSVTATRAAWRVSVTWTMRGSKEGRSLTSKIRATAATSRAFAPRP
jgi:hypothetical protein